MNSNNDFLVEDVQNKLKEYYLKLKELTIISRVYTPNPIPELGEQLHQVGKQLGPIEEYLKNKLPVRNTNLGYILDDNGKSFMFKVGVFETPEGLTIKHNLPLK